GPRPAAVSGAARAPSSWPVTRAMRYSRRMVPERRRSVDDEVARSDRRWFLAAAVVFAGSLGGLLGAAQIYRATGPHPDGTLFIRRIKRYANMLLRHGFRRP